MGIAETCISLVYVAGLGLAGWLVMESAVSRAFPWLSLVLFDHAVMGMVQMSHPAAGHDAWWVRHVWAPGEAVNVALVAACAGQVLWMCAGLLGRRWRYLGLVGAIAACTFRVFWGGGVGWYRTFLSGREAGWPALAVCVACALAFLMVGGNEGTRTRRIVVGLLVLILAHAGAAGLFGHLHTGSLWLKAQTVYRYGALAACFLIGSVARSTRHDAGVSPELPLPVHPARG